MRIQLKQSLTMLALLATSIIGVTGFASKSEASVLTRACYNNTGVACNGNTVSSIGYSNFSLNIYGRGQRVNSYSTSAVDDLMRVSLPNIGN